MFSPSIMHPFYETRDAPFGLVGIAAPQHGQILSNHASHCSFFLLSAQASSLLSFLSTPRYLRFQWPPQKCRRFVRPLTLVLIQSPNKSNTNYSSAVFNLMLLSLVRPVSRPVSLFCAFQSRLYCVEKRSLICRFWLLGQTGLGKSTLINTIFASHLIDSKGRREADEPVRQTTEIQTVSHGALFSSWPFEVVAASATPLTCVPRGSYHRKRGPTAP